MILQVEDNGLLGVTQALSSFGAELAHQPPANPAVENPFASPTKMTEAPPAVGFGSSPALSVVAQHGSAPTSPHTPVTLETHGTYSPPSSVRLALFQVSHSGVFFRVPAIPSGNGENQELKEKV